MGMLSRFILSMMLFVLAMMVMVEPGDRHVVAGLYALVAVVFSVMGVER